MMRQDLIKAIKKEVPEASLSNNTASKIIDTILAEIISETVMQKKCLLADFGTFKITQRKERIGRNPKTGEPIKIAQRNSVKFSLSKTFKTAINL